MYSPSKYLYDAMIGDDLPKYKQLKREYPEEIGTETDRITEFEHAGSLGRVRFLEFFMELGVDVNASNDSIRPVGALGGAAANGHLEAVRWLLDRGATINHMIQDRPHSFALWDAAIGGHFEIVKLLVERGAEINEIWNGQNAVGMGWSHPEILAYLRSKGGMLPAEILAQEKGLPGSPPKPKKKAKRKPPKLKPSRPLTLKDLKKLYMNLRADLVAYLRSDGPKSFDFQRIRELFGVPLTLIPLDKLRLEVVAVCVETTPYENDRPEPIEAYWAVPVVNLTGKPRSPRAPAYSFLWLPAEERYGSYDDEYNHLMMFKPNVTWTKIVRNVEKYFKATHAEIAEPDYALADFMCPWPKYPPTRG